MQEEEATRRHHAKTPTIWCRTIDLFHLERCVLRAWKRLPDPKGVGIPTKQERTQQDPN